MLEYPEVLYRADSYAQQDWPNDNAGIFFTEWYVVKHTPCGVWVATSKAYILHEMKRGRSPRELGCRWVALTGRKRYAYPTKEEAIESLRIRKVHQIHHAKAALFLAETTLKLIKEKKYDT